MIRTCDSAPSDLELRISAAFEQREALEREDVRWRIEAARAPICTAQVDEAREERVAACTAPPPDDILVVLDASRSMGWDMTVDPEILQAIERINRQVDARGNLPQNLLNQYNRLVRQAESPREPDRIDAARDALSGLLTGLSQNARLRLISFADCGRVPREEGVFGTGDASAYRQTLDSVRLRNNTALAAALDAIPRLVTAGRTADRPAAIILVSDGEDSCRGDPCAAARRLASTLPHAQVSVVSLGAGIEANRCIAEATGGAFYEANNVDRLSQRLRQTTGQLSRDECEAIVDEEIAVEGQE
ncbi:VWA domain-containing protein [Jannaschia sp. W003]|uniref:vWA domain-containing protein n=1 Tax=Jannaschia sp. W003 TaxID=2867012 RepID=UPI0021A389ED|nr:VWA domain-containing protein [Jannaschia sp. W003]UWQ23089.1 VWA domain-containing protein [Jannaschia sp. W003]